LRNFISLPEKKSSIPALATLGQVIVNKMFSFTVTRVLSFKNDFGEKSETELLALGEDIKTMLALPASVSDEQSK
jgi:hypothetical protein